MSCIIYNRDSTKEQNPELQKKDCVEFCKQLNLEVVDIVSEHGSAYKLEKVRPLWEAAIERAKKEKLDIVVWKYDRAFRNREEFYKFMKVMFEVHGLKVYSVKESSIMLLWDMADNMNIEDPTMNDFLQGIMKKIWELLIKMTGEAAEEDSRNKGARVKLAVRRKAGKPTKSYKGNKWGRRKQISKRVEDEVIRLKTEMHMSIREIAASTFYTDKNNHRKNLSVAGVHKILKENGLTQQG